jgi:hypothetical protein
MKKKILLAANVVVIIGLIAFGGYYFKKYRDVKNNPASAEQAAQAQADKTIDSVSKLYDLPKDEKPSVATVSDKDKLKDQPFFVKAENGDITLIYSKAKLAILYRPTTNQIINVSSVTLQGNAKVKVIGTAAARQAVATALTAAQITSTDGGDAKTPPTAIVVVDVTGQNADQAKKVADTVKGTVGTLPAGEDKPTDADILIVAGP